MSLPTGPSPVDFFLPLGSGEEMGVKFSGSMTSVSLGIFINSEALSAGFPATRVLGLEWGGVSPGSANATVCVLTSTITPPFSSLSSSMGAFLTGGFSSGLEVLGFCFFHQIHLPSFFFFTRQTNNKATKMQITTPPTTTPIIMPTVVFDRPLLGGGATLACVGVALVGAEVDGGVTVGVTGGVGPQPPQAVAALVPFNIAPRDPSTPVVQSVDKATQMPSLKVSGTKHHPAVQPSVTKVKTQEQQVVFKGGRHRG